MNITFHEGWQYIAVDDFLPSGILHDIQAGHYDKVRTITEANESVQRERCQFRHANFEAYLSAFVQRSDVQDGVREWRDLSWRALSSSCITGHEQFVSKFEPGQCFNWHVDNTRSNRYLSFFIPLNEPGGGELLFHREGFPTRGAGSDYEPPKHAIWPPKANRLLILPTWYPHRSLEAAATRWLLHGHFNVVQ